ncbi:MAG: phosphate ABC transporter substrate-binding protein PstS [Hydrogenobacter thermophilus]|uniref:phosphate ABC transporter substrate-binding protein PstS n=1 Tax=Hydrogenobacter thermophilus TaxID=940 RepID=UPI001C74410D|nr:phosphate ABC transporter substrate-binding protein PstS [Hydrogenobacter thermophilus]QWK19203.1 MAG: phosphate ABC transporter substrate-binding protein PstS [Hydrogenobacter thermophilus]
MKKLALAVAALAGTALAVEITGAGATFPYPVYSKWAYYFEKETGNKVNYQSIGSGGGIRQITNRTVDFGASDAPLEPVELQKHNLLQFPTVIGAVVLTYNVPEIGKRVINLDQKAVCDIYMGKIKKWNDPYLKQLNPNVNLPDRNIVVVHRSDGSGTTWIFTNWLSKVCPEWKEKVGFGTSVKWPAGVGGKGNEGVTNYVKRSQGGIGYVEYIYAKQNNLPMARIKNREGNFVEPSVKTIQNAAGYAKWEKSKHFYEVLTDQPGKDTYPIAGATFILLAKDQPERSKKATTFFKWAYEKGDKYAEELNYIPMPQNVKKLIFEYWKENGVAP